MAAALAAWSCRALDTSVGAAAAQGLPEVSSRASQRRHGRMRASDAGWSSLVARWAHNPKVASSNLAPATRIHECPRALAKPASSGLRRFLALADDPRAPSLQSQR